MLKVHFIGILSHYPPGIHLLPIIWDLCPSCNQLSPWLLQLCFHYHWRGNGASQVCAKWDWSCYDALKLCPFSPTRACLSLMSSDVDSPHPDVLAELNMIESIGELMKLGFSCLPVQGTSVQICYAKRGDGGTRWIERWEDSENKTKALHCVC